MHIADNSTKSTYLSKMDIRLESWEIVRIQNVMWNCQAQGQGQGQGQRQRQHQRQTSKLKMKVGKNHFLNI